MNKNVPVNPKSVHQPIGPYSNGLLSGRGRLLAIAGQAGITTDGRAADGAEKQADIIFENIRVIVESAGGRMDDLVSLTIYLKDASSYPGVNAARKRHLVVPYPASATVCDIGFLTDGMEVEISAFAMIPDSV